MIRLSLLLLFLVAVTPLWAEEESCDGDSILGNKTELAETATKVCSPIDLEKIKGQAGKDLSAYYGQNGDELCTCLSKAKFNEARVPWGRKKKFIRYEYDKAIREKLNHSLNDLVGNFTKFDNLLLTKTHLGNIVDESQPLCNIKTLARDVAELQKKEGTPDCPSPICRSFRIS
ncbi:MAG: hypothetical protein NDI69_14500 [Bacteriovoracaceae bacterium]|nr:hypothetical protein [Bacteriovoracaceae bacterium]